MTRPIDQDAHDESLENLLSHIKTIEPDHGFNQRVLQGVEARRVERERRPKLLLFWSFASAAALACALAFVAVRKPVAPASPVVANAPTFVQPQVVAVLQPAPANHRKRPVQPDAQPKAPADFPAPEAPLTAEEKLLLRVAHHPDPDEVATLNPEERAELELRDQVAFQRFFDPEPRPKRDHN